jgi:hypothetical protein
MQKDLAIRLKKQAEEIARQFSNPHREGNPMGETFQVYEIIPTSDQSAIVTFEKSTGKQAVAFFYYIPRGASQGWKYFFPTDSHIAGMRAFEIHKMQAEQRNYQMNFLKMVS